MPQQGIRERARAKGYRDSSRICADRSIYSSIRIAQAGARYRRRGSESRPRAARRLEVERPRSRSRAPLCGRRDSEQWKSPGRNPAGWQDRVRERQEQRCWSHRRGKRRERFRFLASGSCDPPDKDWSSGDRDHTIPPQACPEDTSR